MTAERSGGTSGSSEGSSKSPSRDGFRTLQDPYERYARLAPALLTMLPIGVTLLAVPTGDADWLKPILGLASGCGVTILLAAMARSAGRRAELVAFDDGLPTLQRLRHRGGATSAELVELHAAVSDASGIELPDAAAEAADPVEADGVYRVAVSRLIAATRDESAYPLLQKENRNYGFIRNLFGLRPVGRVLAAISFVGAVTLVAVAAVRSDGLDLALGVAAIAVSAIALGVFFVWLNPARLAEPANAYADRLFEAAGDLPKR